jgi:hypothetical protein
MMVEAAPPSALIVIETDLLLQVLEVTFDPPAEFRRVDERRDLRAGGEPWIGKPLKAWRCVFKRISSI